MTLGEIIIKITKLGLRVSFSSSSASLQYKIIISGYTDRPTYIELLCDYCDLAATSMPTEEKIALELMKLFERIDDEIKQKNKLKGA
ncbi:MAG: hypothetical protein CMI54_02035 [Parcubacteria group bacterium]|jgi:hypothetical protein|nr:hypothetical protein [Parcubacteria group bacterium]|tara:strand:- start:645 stop:905 length:261 start_codon:yes stop_codon:yes gene_type:complete